MTARDLGLDMPESRLREAIDEADRSIGPQIYDYLGRTSEFWSLYDDLVLDRLGVERSRQEFKQRVNAIFEDPSQLELFPDALPTLSRLTSKGLDLGIISNYHDGLIGTLRHLGIAQFFRSVTFSQEARAMKPDRRIYEFALRRAGCSRENAIHVGDSWGADYEGAQGAGLRGIWLNRDGRASPTPCESITTLTDLVL